MSEFIKLCVWIILPVFLYIYGARFRHGMTIILTWGSVLCLAALLRGHILLTFVYAVFIFIYVAKRAGDYSESKKNNTANYEEFKDYVDFDYSDVEEMFGSIFGSDEKVDKNAQYKKEFQQHFKEAQSSGQSTEHIKTDAQKDYAKKDYSKKEESGPVNETALAYGLRYYARCMTVEDAKKAYKKYAVTFHPDNPVTGDEEKFIQIDTQYNKFMELFGERS